MGNAASASMTLASELGIKAAGPLTAELLAALMSDRLIVRMSEGFSARSFWRVAAMPMKSRRSPSATASACDATIC